MLKGFVSRLNLGSYLTGFSEDQKKQVLLYGRRHRPDYWILALCVILLVIGLVVIYSISPAMSEVYNIGNNYYVGKQLLAIILGLIAFFVAAKVPLTTWQRFMKPLIVIVTGATLLAIAMPVNLNYPAHRWVRLGSLSFESVELLKFVLIIWLAKMLADRIHNGTIKNVRLTLRPLIIALLMIGAVVAMIQSDLGSMGVIIIIMGTMLFVAGMPLKKLALASGIIAIGLALAVVAFPYRRERLIAYLHPSVNCQGADYQACQAVIGVGSGGLIGLGLGNSVQAYGYLPESVNDSIFAIYAEKFGFVGTIILLAIFFYLFARIKNIAERAPDDFSRLLVIGVLCWLSIQALINIGAMIGVFPLKGITLPLISYGGTSIVFTLAAIGLVFQVSSYTSRIPSKSNRGVSNDDSTYRRGIRRTYHPYTGNSSRT